MAWSVLLILVGSIAGSAIWFFIIQKWIIGDVCPWCMTAHTTGVLLAILVIWRAIKELDHSDIPKARNRIRNISGMVLIGLAVSGLMAASQIIFKTSTVYSGDNSSDQMPPIDYEKVPMVGSPDASYIVSLLFDYQCSHCQKIHFMLSEAVSHYSGKLAFALFPAPLNTECNPYVQRNVDAFKNSCELARISLAVWLADREAFPVFEDWMFTFETGSYWLPRSLETTREKAVELVGQTKFDAAFSDPWIGQYLQTSTQIYGKTIQNGMGGIPKMIFGPIWVIPQPEKAEDLIAILQNSLAVPKP
jgi:protein-disulfide isomerase